MGGELVLGFDVGGDAVPAVAFEVCPAFKDVDGSTALQGFIPCVEGLLVGFAVFVEDNVGFGGVALLHEAGVLG